MRSGKLAVSFLKADVCLFDAAEEDDVSFNGESQESDDDSDIDHDEIKLQEQEALALK